MGVPGLLLGLDPEGFAEGGLAPAGLGGAFASPSTEPTDPVGEGTDEFGFDVEGGFAFAGLGGNAIMPPGGGGNDEPGIEGGGSSDGGGIPGGNGDAGGGIPGGAPGNIGLGGSVIIPGGEGDAGGGSIGADDPGGASRGLK